MLSNMCKLLRKPYSLKFFNEFYQDLTNPVFYL